LIGPAPVAVPLVALATWAGLPDGDGDAALLVDALAVRGVAAGPAVWDDPAERWGTYDLVVVRTVWDYVDRRDAFLAWARSVPRLANPAGLLAWNTDKRYLEDLERAGLPVVRTTWISPADHPGPDWLRAALAGGLHVVKPSVSAGSMDTARYGPDEVEPALEHVVRLQQEGRTAMVQPYLSAVDEAGETGLVFLDGRFSHAIRKEPMLAPGVAARPREELVASRQPSAEELDLAHRVVALLPEAVGPAAAPGDFPLLYARVDLLPDPDRGPVVIEVELTEPALFLSLDPPTADRLADAIAWRVGAGRPGGPGEPVT
jgi:glutathione synthase/RimK-type ligase-like ATP-grasp enzyme